MVSFVQASSYVYAMILIAGGVMGFAKAQSWVSLGMGIGSGALMLVLELNAELPQAAFAQIATSVVLAVVMGFRYTTTYKFMPAGLVCVLSAVMAVLFLMRPAKNITAPKSD